MPHIAQMMFGFGRPRERALYLMLAVIRGATALAMPSLALVEPGLRISPSGRSTVS